MEYVQGLTGEQLALWKLHYKLELQQHIDDWVFLAQIADQKAKTTTWKEMYKLDHTKSTANPMTTPTSQLPDTLNYLATFTIPQHNDEDDVLPRL